MQMDFPLMKNLMNLFCNIKEHMRTFFELTISTYDKNLYFNLIIREHDIFGMKKVKIIMNFLFIVYFNAFMY